MEQFASLLLHGGDDLGMTVSGGSNGDSSREVEELVAVYVFNHDAVAAFGDQGVGAGVGGRDEAIVICDDAFCNGAGELGANDGGVGVSESRRWHWSLLVADGSMLRKGYGPALRRA